MTMTSKVPLTILALMLSACGHLAVNPPPLLSEDEMITVSPRQGAQSLKDQQGCLRATGDDNSSMGQRSPGMSSYCAFNAALQQAQQSPSESNLMDVLEEGMHLITATCMRYFTRLGRAGQHVDFARKETSLASTLAASGLGLAGASATAIAGTASAFGFSLASIDNYSESYLFAPDIAAVQTLVLSALDSHKAIGRALIDSLAQEQKAQDLKVGEQRRKLTYTEVNQFLLVMQTSCQPHGIRSLVTQSVAGNRAEPVGKQTDGRVLPNSPQLLKLVPVK